jgi:hypothetical protein
VTLDEIWLANLDPPSGMNRKHFAHTSITKSRPAPFVSVSLKTEKGLIHWIKRKPLTTARTLTSTLTTLQEVFAE